MINILVWSSGQPENTHVFLPLKWAWKWLGLIRKSINRLNCLYKKCTTGKLLSLWKKPKPSHNLHKVLSPLSCDLLELHQQVTLKHTNHFFFPEVCTVSVKYLFMSSKQWNKPPNLLKHPVNASKSCAKEKVFSVRAQTRYGGLRRLGLCFPPTEKASKSLTHCYRLMKTNNHQNRSLLDFTVHCSLFCAWVYTVKCIISKQTYITEQKNIHFPK